MICNINLQVSILENRYCAVNNRLTAEVQKTKDVLFLSCLILLVFGIGFQVIKLQY
jgi:hypothetical protein